MSDCPLPHCKWTYLSDRYKGNDEKYKYNLLWNHIREHNLKDRIDFIIKVGKKE